MKLRNSFFYTIREDVKEESMSGKLLVRSGMITKTASGIYTYLPMGLRVLHKIEDIVREEMNKASANELLMPSLLPEEVYVKSGRRDFFGGNMFSLQDRYNRAMVLGPTHEEFFVEVAKNRVHSYKDLPFNLYQIGKKYRDETRPRYGLIRVREFIMKDAYSFDRDLEGLDVSYQKMYQTYQNIFDRIGIDYRIVKADTGAMGGLLSEEFQAITPIGEDTIVLCEHCGYASNIEVCSCLKEERETKEMPLPKELVFTPDSKTIDQISSFLGEDKEKFVKTLIYEANGKCYAVLLRGDYEVNELKLSKVLGGEVTLADSEKVEECTQAKVGFAGPIGLSIPVILDEDVLVMKNFIVGANKTDYHYRNVNLSDFDIFKCADIKNIKEGDPCPKCSSPVFFKKGIEIGNIFKLGTKYSESLHLQYLNEKNILTPVEMGCYGIGIERILAAYIEQHCDEAGMIFDPSIAPYVVSIVVIDHKDSFQMEKALELYEHLQKEEIDVLLDDRDERPGVKFKDMDLIGIPIRITVGKKVTEDIVEMKLRKDASVLDVPFSKVIEEIKKYI